MNGELVVVEDVTGALMIRRVCHAEGSKVFVTSEKAFNLIKNGCRNLFPIGFDAEKVFAFQDGMTPATLKHGNLKSGADSLG